MRLPTSKRPSMPVPGRPACFTPVVFINGRRRTIHRLGMESQITTLTAAEIAAMVSSGRQVPVAVSYQRCAGAAVTLPQLLARCGGNGEWLEWLAAA